jgi:undecaprenyl-diphosphatase
VVSVAVAGFLWWRRQYRAAIVLAAASSLAVVVTTVAKLLVGRSRPLAPLNVIPETEPSFPSGHVLVAGVVVAVTIMMLWAHLSRVGRAVALGLGTMTVLAVCADRLVLGAHWTSDVLASLALTGIIAAGAWVLALLLRTVADSFVVTLN